MSDYISSYLDDVARLYCQLPIECLSMAAMLLSEAAQRGSTIYLIGNGGSAALASHFACDLSKATIGSDTSRVKAISLCDNGPLLSAWANDTAYERVFVEQLTNLLIPGDVLVAISGSGNSPNVLRAVEYAIEHGNAVIGLTGFDGGALIKRLVMPLVVPSESIQQIEDVHLAVCHALTGAVAGMLSDAAPAQVWMAVCGCGQAHSIQWVGLGIPTHRRYCTCGSLVVWDGAV